MKVVVFGGAGFLGGHVADALTAAGYEVTIFDVVPSRWTQRSQRMIVGDILDFEAVKNAVEGSAAVYNFAGLADIDDASTKPVETIRTNVLGCVHQLEAARLADVRRFVFASSIYVFSDTGGFYRASKQACELYIEEYQRRFGLNYTVLRYGTLYGRRADLRNSVHRYLRQALIERRITVPASGEEIREYIHVADAARLSVDILSNEFQNESVVLTGFHSMKFRDLLEMIREIVGLDVSIELAPPSPEMVEQRGHYTITPYTFRPKLSRKLVNHHYIDLGQGLLDCLDAIYDDESLPRVSLRRSSSS